VPAEKFVEAISEIQPAVVGMSALLTTALESMKNTVDVIKNAGLRDQVKIMVGGGAVDEKVRKYTAADAYGPDAVAAVNLSREWVQDKG
jgi:methanogenic corrinoid protein MtbC1